MKRIVCFNNDRLVHVEAYPLDPTGRSVKVYKVSKFSVDRLARLWGNVRSQTPAGVSPSRFYFHWSVQS
jgi:hypothetical protein